MGIFEKLSHIDSLPMHMPGHKRNVEAFEWLKGAAERDITEIQGFDNLNEPQEDFREMEEAAARLWGAGESVALVNGSTLGILASVLAVMEDGGTLLMARGSHLSVYHAAQLARARTRYLTPAADPALGIPLSVTPGAVAAALDAWPDIRLVCVTSPTYEGVISDTAGIARECHARGVPLLVDEAHGAHLGFAGFPGSSVRAGADLTVQSLHKTLPALTQTAILHINPGLVDPERVRRAVAMLQSSSPSYLLSASIEKCVLYLRDRGQEAAETWLTALREFREEARGLSSLRLWAGGEGVFALDPSKLLLVGEGLGERLRRDYRIEPEYVRGDLTLCMTGLGDTRASLGRLLGALSALDGLLPPWEARPLPSPALPVQAMPLFEAAVLPGRLLPLREAAGRISGEYVWTYPPGVPCLVPGEVVSEDAVKALSQSAGLHFTRRHSSDSIFCVDLPGKMV